MNQKEEDTREFTVFSLFLPYKNIVGGFRVTGHSNGSVKRRRIFRRHRVPVSAVPVLRSEGLCWRAVQTQFSNRVEVLKNTQMKDITL